MTLKQKVVLIKTGEKNKEKAFLGYEFSNRRGSEGIHPIQRSKTIDDCTQLYDATTFENPTKASTYIYNAFKGNFDLDIHENLKENVSYQNLANMLTFDRVDFEKNISLSTKKKVKIESKWDKTNIGDIINEQPKSKIKVGTAKDSKNGEFIFFTSGEKTFKYNEYLVEKENIFLSTGGNAIVKYYNGKASYSTDTFVINSQNENNIKTKYIFYFLENIIDSINEFYFAGVGLKHLQKTDFRNIKIPLPPKDIQEKIVLEIEQLEQREEKAVKKIEKLKTIIEDSFSNLHSSSKKTIRLSDEAFEVKIGKRVLKSEIKSKGKYPVYSANVFKPFGYIEKELLTNFTKPFVVWGIDGDWMVNTIPVHTPFYPTDHCGYMRVLKPIIEIKYLAFVLNKAGNELEFSRNKRASIDRIEGIKIPLPSLISQQKTVAEIEKLEIKINALEKQIAEIPKLKTTVLKKYL